MTWRSGTESQASAAVTPEDERVLKYPVREEQPPPRNFTPVQIVILFIQFCLVGIFLGAIIYNDPEDKDPAPSQKFLVLTVEREKKAGGGFKYRLVGTKKSGIEAIIMENNPSEEQPSTFEDAEAKETTITEHWMTTFKPALKFTTTKQKLTGPPQASVPKEAFMPTPPVPPPWSSTRVLLPGGDTKKKVAADGRPTTMKPIYVPSSRKTDYFRG